MNHSPREPSRGKSVVRAENLFVLPTQPADLRSRK